nr:PREDICTED: LOW QUALITY PROTEIN: nitrate reductase [NADH] 3-like [Linepithema humile]
MTDVYTADEVAHHDHEGDLWIVIHGKIYNLTSFLKEHPGGEEVLLALAGEDGTDCFDSIGHSQEALLLREKFYIGELVGGPRSQPSRKQETNAGRLYEGEVAKHRRDMAGEKQFTRSEIEKNKDIDKVYLILHDKVYNVHSFLNEHPGGEEILLDHKGKDASEDFDDVGHSNDAMELMKKYHVGELTESDKTNKSPKKGWVAGYNKDAEKSGKEKSNSIYLIVAGIVLAVALIYYVY